MTKLPGWGHQGRGISGLWGLLLIFLSLSCFPPFLFLLLTNSCSWEDKTGRAGFWFTLLSLWLCPGEKMLCIGLQLSYCPLCPGVSTPLPLVKSKHFKENPVGWLACFWTLFFGAHFDSPVLLCIYQTCVFSWALAWEAEGRSQKAFTTDPDQAVIRGDKNCFTPPF